MQHHSRRRTRTSLSRQLDLLAPNRPSARCPAPAWDTLPQQTRGALSGLLARLLIEYASGVAPVPGRDADEH